MSRKTTGTQPEFSEKHEAWTVRARIDGRRRIVIIPTAKSEAEAASLAPACIELARKVGLSTAPDDDTFTAWAKRWCTVREKQGLRSVKDDRSRLANHVEPLIGKEAISTISSDRIEDLRDSLDAKIRTGAISWKTAGHVWGLVTKAFDDACTSKERPLRVRKDNPTVGVKPPDRGIKKAKSYLFPSEFIALVSCAKVPLRWRRLFAIAVYTYGRRGEIEALSWADVDLEHGNMHIHTAADRETGELGETKTGITRTVPIERNSRPLLEAMHAERGFRRSVPTAAICTI